MDQPTGFNEQEARIRNRYNRVGALMVFVTMPAGIYLDSVHYPENVHQFFLIRCAASAIMLLLLVYDRFWKINHQVFSTFVTGIPILSICLMIKVGENAQSIYHEGLNLVILGGGILLRWTTLEALLMIGGTILLYIWATIDLIPFGLLFSNLFFMTVTGALVGLGSMFYHRLRQQDFALRQRLGEQNHQLKALDQAKNDFLANVSHELRTPLALILAPIEMLRARSQMARDPKLVDATMTLQENANRLLRLVNEVIEIVNLSQGAKKFVPERLSLHSFFQGLIRSVSYFAERKRIEIMSEIDEHSEEVFFSREALEKIVLNLLINAVKYTPNGGQVYFRSAGNSESITFSVSDTGMGISENDLRRVFDRFWKAESSDQKSERGMGLGLALVKETVEALGGTISVESSLGKGSTFTVQLPLSSASEMISVPVQETLPSSRLELETVQRELEDRFSGLSHLVPEQLKRMDTGMSKRSDREAILIADDENLMRRFIVNYVVDSFPGLKVLEASDGKQAFEIAKLYRPKIIILDSMMPEMDGPAVCEQVRSIDQDRETFILMLTARVDESSRIHALEKGADDFMAKPFSLVELRLRINHFITLGRQRALLQQQKSRLQSALDEVKEYESQLIQSEKLASLGRMAAGLIHEINNPINYAYLALKHIEKKSSQIEGPLQGQITDLINDVADGMDRIIRLTSDLRSFTKVSEDTSHAFPLETVVTQSLRLMSHELEKTVITVTQADDSPVVRGNSNQCVQVLVNLLQNAVDAVVEKFPDDPERRQVALTESGGDTFAEITIEDNGTGIDDAHRDRLFEPFFTTKPPNVGMGLGLSICYRIARAHGGDILLKEATDGFSTSICFRVPVSTLKPQLQ